MYPPEIGQQREVARTLGAIDHNPTVEENIDGRIKHLQSEIDRLQKSKEDLGPLLKMRIRDIRSAMDLY